MDLVWGSGPKPCEIMVIGEAPGANEQEQGVPFVGASGKLLDRALFEAGIPREEVYVTNVYKLRPPNNRTPTWSEINSHIDLLLQEFREVNPLYVLLLGNTALEAVSGRKGITKHHGVRLWNPYVTRLLDIPESIWPWACNPDSYWYSTYHPAATMYNSETKQDFLNDIKVFGKIARGMYTLSSNNTD